MLICVCPNPAIDHTVVVPRLAGSETLRATHSRTTAGGKGLNVARFAVGFGAKVQAVTWLGETGADLMHALARRDGVHLAATIVPGMAVRVCPVIVSTSDGRAVSVADSAPQMATGAWWDFVDLVAQTARRADVVCIAGSFPRVDGVVPVQALLTALGSSMPVWVDTSGYGLADASTQEGLSLKVNLAEARTLLGDIDGAGSASDRDQALAAVESLGRDGRDVVVTAGDAGAASRTSAGLRWLDAPKVTAVNATASGDAFMAGYLCAGQAALADIADPLRAAVLAGAANAQSWAPEAPTRAVIDLNRKDWD